MISIDAKNDGQGNCSLTVSAGGVLFVVAVGNAISANPVATYNSVPMTRIFFEGSAGGLSGVAIFYLTNPTIGSSQSAAVTGWGGGDPGILMAISFLGVDASNPIDTFGVTNSTGASSLTVSLVTNFANSLLLDGIGIAMGTVTPGAGQTQQFSRLDTSSNLQGAGSTMPTTTAGSYSMTESGTFSFCAMGAVAIKASVPVAVTAADTTIVTDATTILAFFPRYALSVSDTIPVTDAEHVGIISLNENDLPATLVVSGYKWLTQDLYDVQQSFVTRPYFSAKILDDSTKPTGISESNVAPYQWGSAAPTPDGNIVAAGFDNTGAINFYKGRNIANGWDSLFNFDSGAALIPAGGQINQVQIAVSDYYRDSYHIDVAYLTNFNSGFGPDVLLQLWRSDDGGVTWNNQIFTLTDLIVASLPDNLYIALMKPRLIDGTMVSAFIYLSPTGNTMASGYPAYQLNYSVYPNSVITTWGGNVDSQDWTIHSFDSFYLNGIDYVVFSGFRNIIDNPNFESANQNPNYELWVTSVPRRAYKPGSDVLPQVWSPPMPIFPANSNTPNNQNQYIFPKATVQKGFVDVIFKSVTTSSISLTAQGSTSTTVGISENYMHTRTQDGFNFSYPDILVDVNGNLILEPSSLNQLQSFVSQDNFYYLCGGNQIIQFIFNNVLADLSADIIGYQIQETAGQPSSITLQVANQDNKWVGSDPTGPGAAAIIRNSKILVQQGFYSNNVPKTAPRNIFYIDDIQQSVTGTNNDLTLVGRDWFKKLITLITRFSLQWIGPLLYTDIFDGSTLANWNQISGNWSESGNQISPAANASGDSIIALTGIQQITYGSLLVVNMGPVGTTDNQGATIYLVYIDPSHWIRLDIFYEVAGSIIIWQIEFLAGSSGGGIYNGTLAISPADWTTGNVGFVVKQYDYYKFNFLVSGVSSGVPENPLSLWNSVLILMTISGAGSNGEFDLSSIFLMYPEFQKGWAVGLGTTGGNVTPFSYFKYTQFGSVNNILSVSEALAAEAGIFTKYDSPPVVPNTTTTTVAQQTFVELLYAPQFSGQFNVLNRQLIIPPNGAAFSTDTTKNIANGKISFHAKAIAQATGPNDKFGFALTFRGSGIGGTFDSYVFRVYQYEGGNGFVNCRFERILNDTVVAIFPNSVGDDAAIQPQAGSLNIDITKYHLYEISMIDGWMYAHIDGTMVAAWNDNNTDLPYLTDGYWGFMSNDSNSTAYVQSITSPQFWKPVQSFSFNPGDDAENAVLSLVQQVRGWAFSDLFGRMKYVLLSPNDQPNFTYDNQIWSQIVDQSDKEYISQVTVYGTGVMATATNTNLMAGVPVRDAVIVDYTITTQSDAQTRANLELQNYNQYLDQYEPTEVLNPGSELFDAVVVVNTGNNTSGVDSPTRIYSQTFNEGGGTNNSDYSVQIQTGNL